MKSATPTRFLRHVAAYWRRRNPQHLIVHVTGRCNFRCRHCFVDFSKEPTDLSLKRLRAFAAEVGPLFWLDIGGGEPFLRRDLPEIVAAFDARVVHIPTNGTLGPRTAEMARAMMGGEAELGVALSLDGLAATHDRLRGRDGSYDQVWDTFEHLRRVDGLAVYVNTVITSDNVDEIEDLMEEVWRRRPDFHAVTLMRGDPLDPTTTLPSLDRLRALAPAMFAILERYEDRGRPLLRRVAHNYHRYLWNVSLATLERRTQVIPCHAGHAHLVVWPDGRVASCEMLPAIGDLRRSSWAEILASPELAAQREHIRKKACHCTHNCALFDSIMFSPRSAPNLLHQPLR